MQVHDISRWPERFSTKVLIKGVDECWPWLAVRISNGYGQFWLNGRMVNAHRAALLLLGIDMPRSSVVMHSCDNRICCNPHHLSHSTQRNNMRDMVVKGRSAKGERHGSAILNEAAVLDILSRRETAAQAANRYHVARATINDIRQNLSWTHIIRSTSH